MKEEGRFPTAQEEAKSLEIELSGLLLAICVDVEGTET